MAQTRKKLIEDMSRSFARAIREDITEGEAKRFLELGADPTMNVYLRGGKSTNAVREAAKLSTPNLTSLILSFGGSPINGAGSSAIVAAAKRGRWDTVLLVKEKLAMKTNDSFDANLLGLALLHAVKDGSDKAYQAAEMLIEADANVNYQREVYYIPRGRNYEKDKKLPNSRQIFDKHWYSKVCEEMNTICLTSPLHLAMYRADYRMITLLTSHGAKNEGKGGGYTPVYVAEMCKDKLALFTYYEAAASYLKASEKEALLEKEASPTPT